MDGWLVMFRRKRCGKRWKGWLVGQDSLAIDANDCWRQDRPTIHKDRKDNE